MFQAIQQTVFVATRGEWKRGKRGHVRLEARHDHTLPRLKVVSLDFILGFFMSSTPREKLWKTGSLLLSLLQWGEPENQSC